MLQDLVAEGPEAGLVPKWIEQAVLVDGPCSETPTKGSYSSSATSKLVTSRSALGLRLLDESEITIGFTKFLLFHCGDSNW